MDESTPVIAKRAFSYDLVEMVGFTKTASIQCLIVAAVWFAFGAEVLAAEQVPPVVVMMVSQDREADTGPVRRAVEGQLSDLEIRLEIVTVPSLGGNLKEQIHQSVQVASMKAAIATFWCDLEVEGGGGLLYLSEPGAERILVRRLEGESEAGRAEAMAIIVRSSVVEMIAGGTIGVRVVEVLEARGLILSSPQEDRPETEEVQELPDRVGRRLFNSVAYTLCIHSREHPTVHGLDLRLGVKLDENWSLALGYTVMSTVEDAHDLVTVRLDRHPIALGVGARFAIGPVWLAARVAGILDYVTFENYTLAPGMLSVSDRSDWVFSILAGLDVQIPISERLFAMIAAGAEMSVVARHYVVEGPDGNQKTILDSWPVQPWVFIGFLVEIL